MCNPEFLLHLEGMECTAPEVGKQCMSARTLTVYCGYKVECSNGEEYCVAPHQLRKKRPPESDDSAARQAMLDCIERAKMPERVSA